MVIVDILIAFIMSVCISVKTVTFKPRVQVENWESGGYIYDICE